MDQPGKVANFTCGQLNRENDFLPCPRSRLRLWSRESRKTGSTVPFRVSWLILHPRVKSGVYTRNSSRFQLRRRLSISLTTVESVASLPGHATAYPWRSLPRVFLHKANCPQGSSSNGCCLFRFHHEQINKRLSFSTPTVAM